MKLSPSGEASSCAATKKFPNILRNPVLSHINPVHTTASSLSLRSILILSTRLRPGLPSILFPLTLTSISYMDSYTTSIRSTCRTHLIFLDLIILIILCEEALNKLNKSIRKRINWLVFVMETLLVGCEVHSRPWLSSEVWRRVVC
jgi:hypothetical protein